MPDQTPARLPELLRQALSFGLVGLINTAVGLGIFYLLLFAAGAPPALANVTSHSIAVCVSFLLNSKLTFQRPPSLARAIRFAIGFGLSVVVNLGVLRLAMGLGLAPELAQLPAMVAYTVTFFFVSRLFVFR